MVLVPIFSEKNHEVVTNEVTKQEIYVENLDLIEIDVNINEDKVILVVDLIDVVKHTLERIVTDLIDNFIFHKN